MAQNIIQIIKWIIESWLFTFTYVDSSPEQVIKEETKTFERLKVKKTVPTPCDREMWLFTLKDGFRTSFYKNATTKFDCNW